MTTLEPEPGSSDASAQAAERSAKVRRVVALFGSTFAFQIVGLLLSPVLARALGPAQRGQVALATVYDDASTAVFHVGMPSAVGYFGKERVFSEASLASSAVLFGFLALPFSLTAGYFTVRYPFHNLDRASIALIFVLVGFSPLLATLAVIGRQFLLNRGDLLGLRRVYLLQLVGRASVVLIAFALHRLTVPVAIAALTLSAYVGSAYAWLRSGVLPDARPAPLPVLLRYGVRALPGSLANLATGRLDQLLIAPLLGTRDLGFYAVGISLNYVIVNVGLTLGTEAFSQVRDLTAGESSPDAGSRIRLAFLLSAGCAVVVGAFVASPAFPLLFGASFQPAVVPGLLLLPGTVAFAVTLVGQQVLIALNRPGWSSTGLVVSVVMLASLMVPATHVLGLPGAAVASSVAYVLGLAVVLFGLRGVGVRDMLPGTADLSRVGSVVARRLRR